jgi:hypothetical protein
MSSQSEKSFEICSTWVHIAYNETANFVETYGFSGNQGTVNLEGVLLQPKSVPSKTLLIFMHPAATLQLLPVPREAARLGVHVLCAGSRYARNDSAAILEKVLLDLGAYVRYAKEILKYQRIVLAGWSGGGSLSLFYQSQAESPTIVATPAGDPVDIKGAGLIAADAVIVQAAHIGRAEMLRDVIDPSVRNELNLDDRDVNLDLYDSNNHDQPPYSSSYIQTYRAAQLERVRRITAWVKETLNTLQDRRGAEMERGFVTHRTMADPRFLDGSVDPNDRRIGWCYLGNPETVNNGPVGLARFSTLRSWLSQWSIDDTQADARKCGPAVSVPLLAIENSADDAVPQSHMRIVFDAAGSRDKTFKLLVGATHYYAGQPEHLSNATLLIRDWLRARGLLEL